MAVRVAYMGIPGSNSEQAATELAGAMGWDVYALIPEECSADTVRALDEGRADYGVVASRNVSAGPVEETVESLRGRDDIEVLRALWLPIHHCVFTLHPGVRVRNVASHVQALLQTREHLEMLYPGTGRIEVSDTAVAAEMLSKGELPEDTAVVCRRNAGEMFGLFLVHENIEDVEGNMTEFQLLRPRDERRRAQPGRDPRRLQEGGQPGEGGPGQVPGQRGRPGHQARRPPEAGPLPLRRGGEVQGAPGRVQPHGGGVQGETGRMERPPGPHEGGRRARGHGRGEEPGQHLGGSGEGRQREGDRVPREDARALRQGGRPPRGGPEMPRGLPRLQEGGGHRARQVHRGRPRRREGQGRAGRSSVEHHVGPGQDHEPVGADPAGLGVGELRDAGLAEVALLQAPAGGLVLRVVPGLHPEAVGGVEDVVRHGPDRLGHVAVVPVALGQAVPDLAGPPVRVVPHHGDAPYGLVAAPEGDAPVHGAQVVLPDPLLDDPAALLRAPVRLPRDEPGHLRVRHPVPERRLGVVRAEPPELEPLGEQPGGPRQRTTSIWRDPMTSRASSALRRS